MDFTPNTHGKTPQRHTSEDIIDKQTGMSAESQVNATGVTSDTQQAAQRAESHNRPAADIYVGKVMLALPFAHVYTVALEGRRSARPAIHVADHSMNPIGAKQSHTLSPQTNVLVYDPPSAAKAYILCVLPHQTTDSEFVLPTVTQMGGNSGWRKSAAMRQIIGALSDTAGLSPVNSGRSIDGGYEEWFQGTETGSGIFLDSFQTWMRASELAGIYFNYFDDYVRLVAENFDLYSPSLQVQLRNDENELQAETGFFTYPWEASGAYSQTGATLKDHAAEDIQLNPNYPFAPVDIDPEVTTDIEPVLRSKTYGGYLGQGHLHQVIRPALLEGARDRAKAADNHDVGLFESSLSLGGEWNVKAAKGIRFESSGPFPVHRRLKAAEDPDGDHDSVEGSYNFSGLFGNGDAHKVFEWVDDDVASYQSLLTLAAEQDRKAHADKWTQGHPFEYHEKDFTAPTDSEFHGEAAGFVRGTKAKAVADAPASLTLTIDHRTGTYKYSRSGATFGMTPDGSIFMESAYGSRLTLGPHGVQIESSGDVHTIAAGRAITTADEVITKAQTAVDTSSKGSIRQAAETNLHMLGANSGSGGILLESKSDASGVSFDDDKVGDETGIGGITLLAKTSQVNSIADIVYQKSTGSGIVMDAGDGAIVQTSRSYVTYTDSAVAHMQPPEEGEDTVEGVLLSPTFTKLGGSVYTDGSIILGGSSSSLLCRGGVYTEGSVIAVGVMAQLDGGPVFDSSQNDIPETLDEAISDIEEAAPAVLNFGAEFYRNFLESGIQAEDQPGNDTALEGVGFSFRDESFNDDVKEIYSYEEDGFAFLETCFQRDARMGRYDSLGMWDEIIVTLGAKETQPWPGKRNWENVEAMLRYGTPGEGLTEAATGYPVPVADNRTKYEEPRYEPWLKTSCKDGWTM